MTQSRGSDLKALQHNDSTEQSPKNLTLNAKLVLKQLKVIPLFFGGQMCLFLSVSELLCLKEVAILVPPPAQMGGADQPETD